MLFWVIYDPIILLTNQFAGFFIFDLLDILILIPVVHCYIALVLLVYLTLSANFLILLCLMISSVVVMCLPNTLHQNLLHIYSLCRLIDINSIYTI